jgi:hypothetical protein
MTMGLVAAVGLAALPGAPASASSSIVSWWQSAGGGTLRKGFSGQTTSK